MLDSRKSQRIALDSVEANEVNMQCCKKKKKKKKKNRKKKTAAAEETPLRLIRVHNNLTFQLYIGLRKQFKL